MKKEIFLGLLITFALFISCNNDDDDPIILATEYRISEVIYSDGSEEKWKVTFTYNNEQLTLINWYEMRDDNEWADYRKEEFVYTGNKVTQTQSEKKDTDWTTYRIYELTFENDLMIEKSAAYYYNGTLQDNKSKYEYSYNGNMLSELIRYYGTPIIKPSQKYEAIYTNNILTKLNYFSFSEGAWKNSYYRDFTYSGDLLHEIIYTRVDDSTNSNKIVYSYTGNLISSMEQFIWRNDTWELYHTDNYLYNSDNYLVEYSYDDRKHVITYEEGKGNAYNLLMDPYYKVFKYPYLLYDD